MYLTIKAYSTESFNEFHSKYGNSTRVSTDVQFDQYDHNGVQITYYNNLTILFKGSLTEDILSDIHILVDKNMYVGSDEVGVGEGVGPIVACGVKFNNYDDKVAASLLGIKDSKKLSAAEINRISEGLTDLVEHKCITMSPAEFNKKYKEIPNVKAINAIIQNELFKMINGEVYVTDEFVNMNKYKEYISDNGLELFDGKFILEQGAEDKYLEVAAAAIMAKRRYNDWMINYCKENNIPLEIKDKVQAQKLYLDIRDGKVNVSDEVKSELVKDWSK